MFKKVNRQNKNWEKLARLDPYWSILVDDSKIGNKWSRDDFYSTGVQQLSKILDFLSKLNIELKPQKAIDYGCGTGRLTEALANTFLEVYGLDFSKNMIELAKKSSTHANVTYEVCNGSDLSAFSAQQFNFVLSLITLQHSPPQTQYGLISEMMRVCKSDGVILFSAVTYMGPLNWLRNVTARLSPRFANYILALYSKFLKRNLGHYKENAASQMFTIRKRRIEKMARERGYNLIYSKSDKLNWKEGNNLEIFVLKSINGSNSQ